MTVRVVNVVMVLVLLVLALPAEAGTAPGVYRLPILPIAYPSYDPGRIEGKTELFTVKITDQEGTALKGFGLNIISRAALDEKYAVDFQLGFARTSGDVYGVEPFAPIPYTFGPGGTFLGYCSTAVAGVATADVMTSQMSINLEYQPLKEKRGSVILFVGPHFTYQSSKIEIPYRFAFAPASFTSPVNIDKQNAITMLGGLQLGAQAEVKLRGSVVLSPFLMLSAAAGSTSISDAPEGSGVPGSNSTSEVTKSQATTYGFDILWGNVSIGMVSQVLKTTLEQIGSSTVDGTLVSSPVSQEHKITMFRLGFYF